MTSSTTAAGADPGLPPEAAPEARAREAAPDVSPGTLRELHGAYVRQLRGRVLGWSAFVGVSVVSLTLLGVDAGRGAWLLVGLLGVQAISAASDWWRARQVPESVIDADDSARERERQRSLELNQRLSATPPLATYTVAGLVVAVTVLEWMTAGSAEATVARAGLVKPLVSDGEWWRLGTAVFLHANVGHLIGNIIALVTFGRVVEARVARHWVWLVYAASGLAGNLASWWLAPHTSSLGASGAVMGVIGFLLVLAWKRPQDLPSAVRSRAAMAILGTAYVGALAFGVIDNAAHAGGAAAGAVIAWFVVTRDKIVSHQASSSWGRAVGWFSAAAIVLTAGTAVVELAGGPIAVARIIPAGPDTRTAVVSVTAHVERDRAGTVLVLTNRHDRMLEAYDVTVHGAASEARLWRDDCCFFSAEHKPVASGQSVRLPLGNLQLSSRVRPSIVIAAVVFDDTTFEGSAQAHEQIVRRRRQVADEATFWIRTLDAVEGDPATAPRRLEAYARARLKFAEVSGAAQTAFGIDQLISVSRENPIRFVDAAGRTKARILASHEMLETRLRAR